VVRCEALLTLLPSQQEPLLLLLLLLDGLPFGGVLLAELLAIPWWGLLFLALLLFQPGALHLLPLL
jgi:hypothetical protein